MALARKATTVVSTKGQVILPKAIRLSKGWGAGTKLQVEVKSNGVLLRPASPFPPTRPEDVFGSLDAKGKRVKIEEFDKAIANEIKSRHDRGRY